MEPCRRRSHSLNGNLQSTGAKTLSLTFFFIVVGGGQAQQCWGPLNLFDYCSLECYAALVLGNGLQTFTNKGHEIKHPSPDCVALNPRIHLSSSQALFCIGLRLEPFTNARTHLVLWDLCVFWSLPCSLCPMSSGICCYNMLMILKPHVLRTSRWRKWTVRGPELTLCKAAGLRRACKDDRRVSGVTGDCSE